MGDTPRAQLPTVLPPRLGIRYHGGRSHGAGVAGSGSSEPSVAMTTRRPSITSTTVRFSATGRQPACSSDVQRQLVRIVEEAVTNAVRHAGGTEIHVQLTYDRGSVALDISDDGVGFNPAERSGSPTAHFGLMGMRERCEEIGGTFRLTSSPGGGTQVRAVVPVAGGG